MEDLGSFVKIYRKFIKWEWYSDLNTKSLFIHCLLSANWDDKKWQGQVIKRGQFVTSIAKLALEIGISQQQIRTSLSKLKSTNEITSVSTNRFTLITVMKYDDYQDYNRQNNKQNSTLDNKQITFKQQTDNKQITTTKEVLELKEVLENNKDLFSSNKESEKFSLFDTFETEFKRPLSQREFMMIGQWKEINEEQLILYALREATVYEKFSFDYIDKILCEWKRKGITVEKYESGEMNE